MSTVLARRTGVREFDFDLDGERHAMGELLGQLSERSFSQARLPISVLVRYLNANDAGPGFYDLATRKHLVRPRPSQDGHYNQHRPHRARNLRPSDCDDITMSRITEVTTARIRRRKVLGGLINEYERAA